jgi:thioredoxin 1
MTVIELNDDNFKSEISLEPGLFVVDFWAEWCGPCRLMGPIFDEVSKVAASKARFGKFNVDGGKTASQYGVMSIPTIMFFKEGQKVETLRDIQTKEALLETINELSGGNKRGV